MKKVLLAILCLSIIACGAEETKTKPSPTTQNFVNSEDYTNLITIECKKLNNEIFALEQVRRIDPEDFKENGESLTLLYSVYIDYYKTLKKITPSEVEAKNHKIFYQNLNKASEVALSYGKIYKKSDDAKNKALVKAKKKYQTFRDDVLFPSANKIDGCNLELSEN
jgi:hypothetical protein